MKKKKLGLLALAIILMSAIVKTPLTAVSSLLSMIQAEYALDAGAAGILNSIPLLAFAVISLFISTLAQRYGAGKVCLGGMLCLTVGIIGCSFFGVTGLYAGMLLIGISIAVGSVLLPAVIKAYFPDHIGPMTSVFTTVMSALPGVAGGISVPLALAFSWNISMGIWAVVAAAILLLWIPNLKCSINADGEVSRARDVMRSPMSWWITLLCSMSCLLFYSLLSWLATILQAKGFDSETAGYFSSLFVLIGIPGSFVIPIVANKLSNQSVLGVCVGMLYLLGIVMLMAVDSWGLILTAVILCGVGTSTVFSYCISTFSIHTKSAADASTLSGMAQSLGYFLGAVGPFVMGKLFDLTMNWNISLIMLLVAAALAVLAGYKTGKPHIINQDD